MDIHKGLLVKILGGRVVKLENEHAPGFWSCDDGFVHVASSFHEVNEAERQLYTISHPVTYQNNDQYNQIKGKHRET